MAKLAVVPSLSVNFVTPDQVLLTRKFVEGMAQYARLWDGPVTAVMQPSSARVTGNLDDAIFDVQELPFKVQAADFSSPALLESLADTEIVMLGGDYRLAKLATWCTARGKRSVYVTEYSLRTRLQIVNAEFRNPVMRLRKYLWEYQQELRNRRSIAIADATQCNGLPTYDVYRRLNPNTLLFLDSRVTDSMLADAETLATRHAELLSGAPLRLAFSGRLNRMKGADELIRVAKELDSLGVDFTLDVFGEGILSEFMAAEIKRERVDHRVRLRGVADFATELMPFVQRHVDLLVCCHRQGDPSCTYLETFACGVPIVGYANEALSGLLRNRPLGWTTPLNRPARLASRIAVLNQNREQLCIAGKAALHFARRHTFETEFAARIDQIRELIKSG